VARQLERHHLAVELAAWDWSAGENSVPRINDALTRGRPRAGAVVTGVRWAALLPHLLVHQKWAADSSPDGLALLAVIRQLANSHNILDEYARPATSPSIFTTWASTEPRGNWARTPWSGYGGYWATATPTPAE